MIGCKRYYKSDEMIGSGDYVFRRYSANPLVNNTDDRFIQYVNGTLDKILPEDFGNITSLPEDFLWVSISDSTIPITPFSVEIPDSVTTIGEDSFFNMFVKEVIFPPNITTINQGIMQNSYDNAIADFSKAKSIPTRIKADEDVDYTSFSDEVTVIKVPSVLYNTWKSRSDWNNVSSKLVSI